MTDHDVKWIQRKDCHEPMGPARKDIEWPIVDRAHLASVTNTVLARLSMPTLANTCLWFMFSVDQIEQTTP